MYHNRRVSKVSVEHGVATIVRGQRKTEVNLEMTARLNLNPGFRPDRSTVLALSHGYLHLLERVAELENKT